jgi:hypothetical protein
MITKLFFLHLVTPAAEDLSLVIEADSEIDALWQAQDIAVEIGFLDSEEIEDPDSEVWFEPPILIEAMTGMPGTRMRFDY